MVTRILRCYNCDLAGERTALGMKEPKHTCEHCGEEMVVLPAFPVGVIFRGPGFHCVDYPKSAAQLKKDYGLDKHDSTNEDADFHQDGYADHMAGGQDI